jgi:D-glycero-D-manno-heptose 1,7-bisphosphate phosphatase
LTSLRPAVFLDRDGTICEEMGYLNHISRVHVFPQAAKALRQLNRAGLPVIIVTNQSGVSREIFPESLIGAVHERIAKELAAAGARVDAFYYCTHTKADRCECRKPLPGLLRQASREHGIELGKSFVVGDRYGDVQLAHAGGGAGILVLTGYGRGEYELHRNEWPRQPEAVVEDITGAVDFILRKSEAGDRPRRPAHGERSRKHSAKSRAGKERRK